MGDRAQGETIGVEQEPTDAGDQDPAVRAPRPDGPMTEHVDSDAPADQQSDDPRGPGDGADR